MKRRAPSTPALGSPVPLSAWGADDGADRLALIERDVAGLIREAADAKAALRAVESEQDGRMEKLLLAIIEVADGFERVFRNIADAREEPSGRAKIWVGNFRTVYRLLGTALKEQGVAPIESPTRQFDPHWHTVVDTVVDPAEEDGTIVREIRRGYLWRKRVLRRADVVVVQDTVPASGPDDGGRGGNAEWDG